MKPTGRMALVVPLLALGALTFGSGIKWNTNLDTALKQAKKSHKPVMVDFYGEH